MYTIVERRKVDPERLQETGEVAQKEFFPKLQQAHGFIGFNLVVDEANGINAAVYVWESKAQADTFESIYRGWQQKLEQFGHTLQTENRGETVITIEPQR